MKVIVLGVEDVSSFPVSVVLRFIVGEVPKNFLMYCEALALELCEYYHE